MDSNFLSGATPDIFQYFQRGKGERGFRLGRSQPMADVMTQYGTNSPDINLSPTFANVVSPDISPNINVTGPSVGDVRIGGGGGGQGPNTPQRPTNRTNTNTTSSGRDGGRDGGGRDGGGRDGGGRDGGGRDGSRNGLGLKSAEQQGQEKNPRVTRSELKDILKNAPVGKVARRIEKKGITLGDKAQAFLDKQLGKAQTSGSTQRSSSNNQTRTPGGATLRSSGLQPLNRSGSNNASLGKTGQAVQAAAATKGSADKLSRSEVSSLLKSGDVSANKILKQIEKGNIDAGKKAIAKAKAAKKKGK